MVYYSKYGEASGMYVNELLKRDDLLISEMHRMNSDPKNIYKIFRERLSLYEQAANMPLIEDDKSFLEFRRNEVCRELRFYKFTQDRKKLVGTGSQVDKIEDQFIFPES